MADNKPSSAGAAPPIVFDFAALAGANVNDESAPAEAPKSAALDLDAILDSTDLLGDGDDCGEEDDVRKQRKT